MFLIQKLTLILQEKITNKYAQGTFHYVPGGYQGGETHLEYSRIYCGKVYKNDKIYIRSEYFL